MTAIWCYTIQAWEMRARAADSLRGLALGDGFGEREALPDWAEAL